jgi:hypothetical protein
LWISNLLSDDKKKNINNVTRYRIQSEDWVKYKEKLDDFCNVIQGELVK